jgi:hypothetical protein
MVDEPIAEMKNAIVFSPPENIGQLRLLDVFFLSPRKISGS